MKSVFKVDWIIIAVLLGISIAISFAASSKLKTRGGEAVVRVRGEKVVSLKFSEPQSFDILGPIGITKVVTNSSGARIVSSPCPHHICMKMGTASIKGQMIVCLPNMVSVYVTNGTNNEISIDGVTG